MQILDIVTYPDKRLRQVAEPVTEFDEELQEQVQSMVLTCQVYRAQGLAAPQVGINKRIFVAVDSGQPQVYINPKIIEAEGTQRMQEGCLSFPGVHEVIERAEDVTVTFQDEEGEERIMCMDGLEAVAVQHELDHLDGILFIDKVSQLKKRLMLKKLQKTTKMPKPKKKGPSKRVAARKERKRQKKHRKRAS